MFNCIIITLCAISQQTSSIILAGLGLAVVGYGGRALMRQMPNAATKMQEALKNMPKFDAEMMASSKYYRGGFDAKMNKREASLILGVSPSASKAKVCRIVREQTRLRNVQNVFMQFVPFILGKGCTQKDYAVESSRSWRLPVLGRQDQRGKGLYGQY